jgi:hypothetical protein
MGHETGRREYEKGMGLGSRRQQEEKEEGEAEGREEGPQEAA